MALKAKVFFFVYDHDHIHIYFSVLFIYVYKIVLFYVQHTILNKSAHGSSSTLSIKVLFILFYLTQYQFFIYFFFFIIVVVVFVCSKFTYIRKAMT